MKPTIIATLLAAGLLFPATAGADEGESNLPVSTYPTTSTWSPPNWGTYPVDSKWSPPLWGTWPVESTWGTQ